MERGFKTLNIQTEKNNSGKYNVETKYSRSNRNYRKEISKEVSLKAILKVLVLNDWRKKLLISS